MDAMIMDLIHKIKSALIFVFTVAFLIWPIIVCVAFIIMLETPIMTAIIRCVIAATATMVWGMCVGFPTRRDV